MRISSYRTNRGVTMVELLIAMVLALLLSVAIVQLFVSNRQTFNVLESTARLQENGRFAMEFITRELRVAGYSGCLQDEMMINNVLDETISNGKPRPMWDFSLPVIGFDFEEGAPEPESGSYPNFSFPGAMSDIITIHTSELLPMKAFQAGNLMGGGAIGEADITTNSSTGLKQNEIVFVTDCSRGAIFRVTNATPATSISHEDYTVVPRETRSTSSGKQVVRYPGNGVKALGHVYGQSNGAGPAGPAEINRFRSVSFYVRNNALYRKIFNEDPEELVRGIVGLQIFYGIASDPNEWGTVSYYVSADEVEAGNDWDKVAAVHIHILLQSGDGVAKGPVTCTFVDNDHARVTITPSDGRVCREFVTTVGLRNQIL